MPTRNAYCSIKKISPKLAIQKSIYRLLNNSNICIEEQRNILDKNPDKRNEVPAHLLPGGYRKTTPNFKSYAARFDKRFIIQFLINCLENLSRNPSTIVMAGTSLLTNAPLLQLNFRPQLCRVISLPRHQGWFYCRSISWMFRYPDHQNRKLKDFFVRPQYSVSGW